MVHLAFSTAEKNLIQINKGSKGTDQVEALGWEANGRNEKIKILKEHENRKNEMARTRSK